MENDRELPAVLVAMLVLGAAGVLAAHATAGPAQ
jgi:hypothetical protein